MDIIYRIDFAILDALQNIHCAALNVFFAFFTYIGEGGAVWIAAAVIAAIFAKTRKMSVSVFTALIFELIVNEKLIKNLVARARPFTVNPAIDTIVHRPSSYSFPSGHTCSSFAAATVIFMYNRKLGIAAYAVAALIGFSRNYFYIHFPTDVLCGALVGIILGFAAVKLVEAVFNRCRSRREDRDL